MSEASKATARPWRRGGDFGKSELFGADGRRVASFLVGSRTAQECEANATLGNEAVDAHDRLQREHEKVGELPGSWERQAAYMKAADDTTQFVRGALESCAKELREAVKEARGE